MSIRNQRQLENTRRKLKLLEESCAQLQQHPGSSARADELTRQSLQSLIKQLKEEIARFESRATSSAKRE